MIKKNLLIGIVALGIVALLIGIVVLGMTFSNSDTIKIGWIGPQTGQSAVLGMDSFVAAQIAIDEINSEGGKIELIIEDDQYNTEKTITAYNKLVNVDGVKFILINTYGGVFALAERAKNDGVVLMDPLDCNGELAGLNKNVFCLATDSESLAEVLAEEAKGDVGILYFNSDLFMPLIEKVFKEEYNGEIILSEAYVGGTKDFKTQLMKMKDADSLLLLGYDETGIAMKQARELGFEGQFYTTGTVTSPSLQKIAGGHAEGTIFPYWEVKENDFTDKFVSLKGREPILDLATYPTYDAVKVLGKIIDGKNIFDINFEGVTGEIKFASDGSMRIKESAYVLVDGKPVKIYS